MGSNNMEMAFKMRSTKFRHVYGSPFRKEHCFENVRITRNAHDSHFCAINPKFLAVVTESAGGGSFIVVPIERTGRVDINCPKVCGHSGAVMDIKWNPFNDHVIASGSDDSTIKIWQLPNEGLLSNLSDWSVDLHGHQRKVGYMEWHPTTENILLTVGFDYKCIVWNVEQAEPVNIIDSHNDTIFSVSWCNDGSLFSTTSKDRRIRVLDPRMGHVAAETEGHPGGKAAKCVFLKDNQKIFTTGFSKMSERQYALWDVRKMNRPIVMNMIDYDSGVLLPYYDPDLNIVYVAGKGNGNIRYYELSEDEPYVHFLSAYQSPSPQRSLGVMPKRGCDVTKCEVFRFYKLHAGKNLIEPISMICPRKSDKFQEDIYPPTRGTIPSLGPDEWIAGQNRDPILVSVSESALQLAPTITTYKAVNKHNQENTRAAPRRANTIATETIINNNNHGEPPASLQNIKRLSTNEDFVSLRPTDSQRIQQSQRNLTSQKQEKGGDTVRPMQIFQQRDIITSDSDDNLPDTLYGYDQEISDWQEDTLRSYQEQPEPKQLIESDEDEFKSPFSKIKETVKRNLEIKPTDVSHASIYEKERERIRSLKRQAQQKRKVDVENYNPEEENNPTFTQAKRFVQKQSQGDNVRPKSMVEIDTSKLEEDLAAFQQARSSNKPRVMLRQRSLEKDNFNPESNKPQFTPVKRTVEKQKEPFSMYRQNSLDREDTMSHDTTVSPFPLTRRIHNPPPSPEEHRKRPPKANSTSPFAKRREIRSTEIPSPIQEKMDVSSFTNRPTYPKLKQENIVTARPFVPFDVQSSPDNKRKDQMFSQSNRVTEKQTQPVSIYRKNSLEKQLEEEKPPTFSQAKRNFETSQEESPTPRITKAGSLSPFAKRREVRSSEIPVREKNVSPFNNRASYPQMNQENIVTPRPFVPFEDQTSKDLRRNSFDKQSNKRVFEIPPPSPESRRHTSQPSVVFGKDQHSSAMNIVQPSQQYYHDNQKDSFMKKDKNRGFDYQPVQKVEPFQQISENRQSSVERRDVNYRTKEVSSSPTADSYLNRASFPPVSSKRFEPVVPQTYENDVDIAAWEEETLRPEDSQIDSSRSDGLIHQIAFLMKKDDGLRVKEDKLRARLERSHSNSSMNETQARNDLNVVPASHVLKSGNISSSVLTTDCYFQPVQHDDDEESNAETIQDNNSDVGDFSERKAMFESNKTPSPAESPSPSKVEKRVWSPTSPLYKEPPSSNGISVSDSDKIHVRKMWQQPQTKTPQGDDYNVPNTDAELKKAYFRQQDEIRQLQEQIALKDKRIRLLEEEVRGIRETSCGPGESNC